MGRKVLQKSEVWEAREKSSSKKNCGRGRREGKGIKPKLRGFVKVVKEEN
jgi:hypothetical protein